MMPDVGKIFYLLVLVFVVLGLLFNFLFPHLPKLPGDIRIDRPNLKVYVPITSALIVSALLTIFFNFFRE